MFGWSRKSLGIDIGSSNTTVVVDKRREILFEPTYVAYGTRASGARQALEFGATAKAMNGKTPPSIVVIRPLRQGAIANFDCASDLIKHLVHRTNTASFAPQRRFDVVASVPESATNVEKRAIRQSLLAAGAGRVTLVRKPIVAAIGAGLNVHQPVGSLVVDIGGGTCEISIISLTDLIVSRSLRIGGETMDEEISAAIKKQHGILIGEGTAEELKDRVGGAVLDTASGGSVGVKGRNAVTGMPVEVIVPIEDIVRPIMVVLDSIAMAISDVIEQAPPDIMSDVLENGVMLTGGVACMKGICEALSARLGLPVNVADEPNHVIARGLSSVLRSKRLYKHITVNAE